MRESIGPSGAREVQIGGPFPGVVVRILNSCHSLGVHLADHRAQRRLVLLCGGGRNVVDDDSLGCFLQHARGQTAGVADDGSRRRVFGGRVDIAPSLKPRC